MHDVSVLNSQKNMESTTMDAMAVSMVQGMIRFVGHLAHERRVSPNTVEAYRRDISDFISYLEEEELPLDITAIETIHIRGYLSHL